MLREPLRNGHSARITTESDGIRTLSLTAVTLNDFSEKYTKVTCADPERVDDLWLKPGDILIQRSNTPDLVGTSALYKGRENWAIYPDLLIRVRLNSCITPEFAALMLRSKTVRDYFKAHAKGLAGSMPKIDQSTIASVRMPVPPLAEQHRIVEALEDHLSRLDVGIAELAKARAKAKRLSSVLYGRAVSGGFSRSVHADEAVDQSAARQASSKMAVRRWKPVQPVRIPDYTLPKNWTTVSLGDLSYSSGYGTSTKCDYGASGYPVLRIPNVQQGSLDLSDMKYALDPTLDLAKFAIDPGDLLFVRTNGSPSLIGRVGVVEESLPYAFASYLIRFRLTPGIVEPRWVQLVTQSPLWRQAIERYAASSAGQYNLSAETLSQLPVPLPPLAVQQETLEAVAAAAAKAMRLSVATDVARTRADHLRSALLQRAFTGQLVPQDPADEPASVLLDRIRAEREAQGGKVKRGTRRPRKAAEAAPHPAPASTPSPATAVQQELPL
ncbi:restriction endonuclease subunit S [Streptomyces sp. NPDC058646]|uniref:restriction endonuclease subunit S n=1 Tax=Streptomyces sp. NPDC058646 TaxID=3346574 RepID=UPI00364F677A